MHKIKIILLIPIILLITSCYDYQEINNIQIVTGIGIDFQNDSFIVTLELLNNSGNKNDISLDTYLITGRGKTLIGALNNATAILNKSPNYAHLKVMILSKSILENHFETIMDYFLRSTEFRENFYLVTTKNDNCKTIFDTKDKQNRVISQTIVNYLENSKSATITRKFEDYAKDFLEFNKSIVLTNLDIEDNSLLMNGSLILNNNKTYYLDQENTQIYNLLINNQSNITLTSDDFSTIINKANIDINIINNNIEISGLVNSSILNNNNNQNIRDLETIKNLNEYYKGVLNDKINNFIKLIKEYNTDILGLDNKYYQKKRKKIKNNWLNLDISININYEINKKGLIYEVTYEK